MTHDRSNHPDLAELDAVRTGEASEESRAHVDTCEDCKAALRELESIANGLRIAEGDRKTTVPAAVDRAMVAMIGARSEEIRDRIFWVVLVRRIFRSRVVVGSFLALAVSAAVLFWQFALQRDSRSQALLEDVDHSGSVDIVDAYLMSRRLGSSEALPAAWDFNHDGRVDKRDVDLVARKAVAVSKEGA